MPQSPLEVVQSAYAAFGSGDATNLLTHFADDVRLEVVGEPGAYPTFGVWEGLEGAAGFFQIAGETEAFSRFEPVAFHTDGETVIVELEAAFTVNPTGKAVAEPLLHIFTVRGGKVARFREFQDTAKLVAAIQA